MALSASSELPTIDFSKEAMKPGTETWDLTCKHVRKALEEYGCFVATFDEINHELYTNLFSSLEKLFGVPKDTKRRFNTDGAEYGYVSDYPQNPLYEAMAVTDPISFQTIQNLALLMWPQGDATFCDSLHSYIMRVLELEKTVRKAIFQSYGSKSYFAKESESMGYSLRIMKYEAPMTDEIARGVGTHIDKNSITILQADGVGLQVQTKDGEWISATAPSTSSLIVMTGELFHGWSNGRLRCPLHRVKLSGWKPRYSIGLFSYKKGTIEIPSEMVDEQHPLLFKSFDYGALMQIFLKQLRDKSYTGDDDTIVPIVTAHFSTV